MKKKNMKNIVLAVVLILVLAAAGLAGFWYYNENKMPAIPEYESPSMIVVGKDFDTVLYGKSYQLLLMPSDLSDKSFLTRVELLTSNYLTHAIFPGELTEENMSALSGILAKVKVEKLYVKGASDDQITTLMAVRDNMEVSVFNKWEIIGDLLIGSKKNSNGFFLYHKDLKFAIAKEPIKKGTYDVVFITDEACAASSFTGDYVYATSGASDLSNCKVKTTETMFVNHFTVDMFSLTSEGDNYYGDF